MEKWHWSLYHDFFVDSEDKYAQKQLLKVPFCIEITSNVNIESTRCRYYSKRRDCYFILINSSTLPDVIPRWIKINRKLCYKIGKKELYRLKDVNVL